MRRWIVLGLVLLLCACTQSATKPTASEAVPSERTITPCAVNEVTDTFAWIGKTASEIGIGRAYFDYNGDIAFSGDLFGHTVNGTAYLLTDYEDPNRARRVSEIRLTDGIENETFTAAALEVRFGEPYASGEEPYVEANGGATYWRKYWTGEGVVTLSNGAKNDYYVFSYIVPKELPSEIARRSAGLTPEDLGHKTGVYFHFAEGEAEDLAIDKTEYEGFSAFLLTFTHQQTPYRVTIVPGGEELFDAKTADGGFTELDWELQTCRYRVNGDGSGILYEKDAFGDFWVIEPGAPTDAEALEAFADFLLHRWLY